MLQWEGGVLGKKSLHAWILRVCVWERERGGLCVTCVWERKRLRRYSHWLLSSVGSDPLSSWTQLNRWSQSDPWCGSFEMWKWLNLNVFWTSQAPILRHYVGKWEKVLLTSRAIGPLPERPIAAMQVVVALTLVQQLCKKRQRSKEHFHDCLDCSAYLLCGHPTTNNLTTHVGLFTNGNVKTNQQT